MWRPKRHYFRGELSTNLNLSNNNLISNESTIYENNDFRYENIKKLMRNFKDYWSENPGKIIKDKQMVLVQIMYY